MREAAGSIFAWIFRPLTKRHEGNLRLIVGCFLLSSLMWVFNSLNKDLQAELVIPLEIHYDKDKFVPLKKIPKRVKVVVSGYGWHLLKFSSVQPPKTIGIYFKFPGIHSRLDTAAFRTYLTAHLKGVRVKQVLLDSISLPFDRKSKKWVHMRVKKQQISLAEGFAAEDIQLVPDSLEVTGPYSHLNKMSDTLFVSIPFKNIDKDFNESIRLTYFFADPNLMINREKIQVKFKVKKNKNGDGK